MVHRGHRGDRGDVDELDTPVVVAGAQQHGLGACRRSRGLVGGEGA
jgi:hypothetical protein